MEAVCFNPVADPEALARRGEIVGHKGGGACPLPRKFLNFKSKNGAFCALFSAVIDIKVCRLITETVSDHIRKTVINRLCFPPLFQSLTCKN